MTDSIHCDEARELAPEVAAGVASAEDRALLLGHIAACSDCSTVLAELSALVDEIAALAPTHEPPAGFESAVLARLTDGASASTRRHRGTGRRMRSVLLVAAAVVLAAALSGVVVYRAHRADRVLADATRATLAAANGEYFAAVPLRDPAGARGGVLFGYQGTPPWMFLVVSAAPSRRPISVELVALDGSERTIGTDIELAPASAWGTVIPVAVHEVAVVRVVDDRGTVLLSASPVP